MANLPQFKGQPWVLFDTIAARSFLVGENRGTQFNAFNTNGPAITQAGNMIFFAAGRTKAVCPWYTNFDVNALLSVGFEAWQVFVKLGLPVFPDSTGLQPTDDPPAFIPTADGELGPVMALAQLIVNFGVLELQLGQEEQIAFPVNQFGCGGGLHIHGGAGVSVGQNSWPEEDNVLALPEPIDMSRTQNTSAIIRLAPEVLPIIGFPVAGSEGVGNPLPFMTVVCSEEQTTRNVPALPFSIQVGLIGKRIKKTQYGQLPPQPQPQ